MSLKVQATRGLKWQGIELVGRQLLSLVVFAILSRLLEPAMFGLFGLVAIYLAIVSLVASQGIGTALIQRKELAPEHLNAAFWFNCACAGALCLATVLLAGPISGLLGEPRLVPFLRWSSLSLLINAVSAIHTALFIRDLDFRRPAIRVLISNFLGGIVGVAMAFLGYGVWSLVGQQLASSLGSSIFLWSVSTYRPGLSFSIRHFKELFSISSSVFATSFLYVLAGRLDQMFIGRYLGMQTLGIYIIAGKIPELTKTATLQPVSQVSLSALARVQNDHGRMRHAIYKGMELNAVISFAVFVGIAAISSDLVPLVFGTKWAGASFLCALLCLNALVANLQVFFHPTLLASGGIGKFVLLNVWNVIAVLAASFVGIQFGTTWLVVCLIANGMLMGGVALGFLRGRIGLDPVAYCQPCVIPAFAALLMAGVIWGVDAAMAGHFPIVLRLAIKVLSGAITYIGVLMIFAPTSLKRLVETIGHATGRTDPVLAAKLE